MNRPVAAAVVVLALSACAAPRADRELQPSASRSATPKAFLWEVTRPDAPDRPLYLTGSIHAGRPEQFEFPPAFERAIARAEVLVVEVDTRKIDPTEVQRLALQLGLYAPPEASLPEHLDDETRALLSPALERIGLTPQGVERLRPWMLAMTISAIELQRAGYDPQAGIDALLLARFPAPKEVIELETVAAQLRVLAGFPEQVQVMMLRDTLRSSATLAVSLAQIAAAWQGGNPDAVASALFTFAGDPAFAPMYQALFFDRNRAMADKLAALAGAPKVHLAVVGAGHLVGERGILAALAERGLRVRQLERE